VKLETYLEQTKGWRGQLETGFVFDPTTINAEKVPEYIGKGAPKTKTTVFEDLSHMNPRSSKISKAKAKEAWAGLTGKQREEWARVRRANAGKQKRPHRKARNGQKK
jgi:hypothetical protein